MQKYNYISYDYQLHCVSTVQLLLQLLQICNQLLLITITNYHYWSTVIISKGNGVNVPIRSKGNAC